jgi:MraZ protein
MLLGNYTTNIKADRRIAIPKKFRQTLGNKFIIAKWYENCLVLVSEKKWIDLLNKLTGKMNTITQPVRDTDRFILGSAFELAPDDQGRVIIPEPLRDYAKFKQSIIFLGLGDRVEIWDKGIWQKREEYIALHAAEMIEKIAKDGRNIS